MTSILLFGLLAIEPDERFRCDAVALSGVPANDGGLRLGQAALAAV